MNLEITLIPKDELSLLMQEEAFKEGWYYSQEDVDFYFSSSQNVIYAVKVNRNLAGCVSLHKKDLYLLSELYGVLAASVRSMRSLLASQCRDLNVGPLCQRPIFCSLYIH
jgi:hypothetical protein